MEDVSEISPAQFVQQRDGGAVRVLLDVRETWERALAQVPDTINIPMNEVQSRLSELDPDKEIVVLCRSGRRSLEVAKFLRHNGYRVLNLTGGILAWSRDLDPRIPTY